MKRRVSPEVLTTVVSFLRKDKNGSVKNFPASTSLWRNMLISQFVAAISDRGEFLKRERGTATNTKIPLYKAVVILSLLYMPLSFGLSTYEHLKGFKKYHQCCLRHIVHGSQLERSTE